MRKLYPTMNDLLHPLRFKLIFFLALSLVNLSSLKAQFTPGKLAVLVIGDGVAPRTSAATPLFIREYNLFGTAQSGNLITTLPATAVSGTGSVNRAVTQSGTAGSEGFLNLSMDRQFLTLTGYNTTAGTAAVATSVATTFPTNTRVVAKINAGGGSDTKTTLFTAYSGTALRSAVTIDGSAYWTAGAPGTIGVGYVPQGNVTAATNLNAGNTRGIGIFNNQLYASTGSGSNRLVTVGAGLPVSGTHTLANLSGFLTTTGDPYSYVFLDLDGNASPDVLYVASLSTAPSGLLKYTSSDSGATWTARGSLTGNAFGVTGWFNACTGNVDLYITANTSGTKPNSLYAFTDVGVTVSSPANITSNGSALSATGLLLASAPTNTAFGGVAFTPGTPAIYSDILPPVAIFVPADTTISCDSQLPSDNAVFSDNYSEPIVVFSDSIVDGICDGNYTVIRTWTATDICGNATVVIQNINIIDNIAPVFDNVPTVFNANCSDDISPGAIVAPTASDNCDAALTVSYSDSVLYSSGVFNYVLNRTWTATDHCGNTTVLVQTINLYDSIPPMINCPQTIRICTANPTVVNYNVTATDNCGLSPLNLLTNPGNESGNLSGWVITLNGGDGWANTGAYGEVRSGNFSFSGSYWWDEMAQEVDLIAKGYSSAYLNTAPPIHVSEWYRASSCCSSTDEYYFKSELLDSIGNVLASYNLGSMAAPVQSTQVWQQVVHTFTGYPAGVTKVRITHGSKDNEGWAGNYGTIIDDALVSIDTLLVNPPSGTVFPMGITPVTATTMDQAGNISTCTFNVVLSNVTGPSISCSGSFVCQGESNGVATATVDNTSLNLKITAPTPQQFPVGVAVFGPNVFENPVAGDFVYFSNPDLGCDPYPPGLFAGKVALIDRGTCSFEQKVYNAQTAGAVGVVIVNNIPGPPVNMGAANIYAITIPVVMVSDADGLTIKNMLSTPATVTGNTTIYSFQWSNGATTATISGLSAGSYTVSVSADNSCLSSCSVQVLENIADSVTIIPSSINNTICQGDFIELSVDPINLAGNFNGNQQWVDLGADITNLNDASFTIEAWVRTTGTGEGIVVSSNNDNIWEAGERAFYIDASGHPAFVGYGNNYIFSNLAVNDGNWHHVAVVRDYSILPGSGAIYVDGVNRTASVTYMTGPDPNIGSFSIGRPNGLEAPNYFTGDMDEVRIWNVSRTATEIQSGILSPVSPFAAGLLAYYKFDERPFLLMNYASLLFYGTPVNNPEKVFAFSYLWAPGGETTYSIQPTASGDYTVTVTNYLGCTTTSEPYFINVIPVPAAPVINSSPSPYFCTGDTITLSADTANAIIDLRYGSTVTSYSSEYNLLPPGWFAYQILGAPNVFPAYGDISFAWASLNTDDQREHIQLAYTNPAPINFIDIYETYNPGAVDTVYVKNPNTGLFEVVYTATASPQPSVARKLHVTFPLTSFPVSEIRIALNSPAVPDWNEIDAVGIGLEQTYLWSTGATTSSISVDSGGYYGLIVSNGLCQSSSTVILVNESSTPYSWYTDMDHDGFGVEGISTVLLDAASEVTTASEVVFNDGFMEISLAQTFTASQTGMLNTIQFNVESLSDGSFDAVFELYSGGVPGSGTLLFSQVLTINTLGWQIVNIPNNTPVIAGSSYYFVIKGAVPSSDFIRLWRSNGATPGAHAGGDLYYYDSFMSIWTSSSIDDLDFREHVNVVSGSGPAIVSCTYPGPGYAINSTDCNDLDSTVNPVAIEICNNLIDDNCNGIIDTDANPGPQNWYADMDQDGFGVEGVSTVVLDAASEVTTASEVVFNDGFMEISLAQTFTASQTGMLNTIQFNVESLSDGSFDAVFELYSGGVPGSGTLLYSQALTINTLGWQTVNIPNITPALAGNSYYFVIKGAVPSSDFIRLWRSNGATPGAHAGGALYYYDSFMSTWMSSTIDDLDFREYVNVVSGSGPAIVSCTYPGSGYSTNNLDCNDLLNTVYPGAYENCTNGIDDNCNGIVDTDAVFYTYYQDLDFDDYGNPAVSILSCLPIQLLPGYTTDSTDCNDNSFSVNPGYTEFCDYIDNDCDGLVDEGVFFTVWPDADQDEYGDSQSPSFITCSPMQAAFGALNNLDCDDSNGDVNPGATEVCGNAIDDDCDGLTDEGCTGGTTFNITAIFEGYYDGNSGMQPVLFNSGVGTSTTECDVIYVELRDGLSTTTVLAADSAIINTNGQVSITFPVNVVGQNGYIVIYHRNVIQTWSNLIMFTAPTIYNFTTAASQAYGSNQREIAPGVWAFYYIRNEHLAKNKTERRV
ncbi:MAG: HYR domain-containing protein [Bacteroidetes bacterium]|nr:HYR domain-containing protein [Bacteroidota bacterium]